MQYENVAQKGSWPSFVLDADMQGIKSGWLNQLVCQENMHLFSISVSLILAALSTRSAADVLDAFAYTCKNTSLSGSTLSSSCQESDGQTYVQTSINLDQCLVNKNGILYCQVRWASHYSTCQSGDSDLLLKQRRLFIDLQWLLPLWNHPGLHLRRFWPDWAIYIYWPE